MTPLCLSDNTTIPQSPLRGFDRGTLGWTIDAVDDPHLRWWGPRGAEYVTRIELLLFAQRQVAHLMNLPRGWDDDGGLPATPQAAKMAIALLINLISGDNLATPQISPTGTGGLDIEWLVSGNHLSLSVAQDGNIVLWAVKPDGTELFSFDSTEDGGNIKNAAETLKRAETFLYEISAGIRNRIAI
jgi:hypothetical protein